MRSDTFTIRARLPEGKSEHMVVFDGTLEDFLAQIEVLKEAVVTQHFGIVGPDLWALQEAGRIALPKTWGGV